MTLDDETFALPVPADDAVALLLQTVWDRLAAGTHWPAYRAIDRELHREHDLDIDVILRRTPQTLLLGGRFRGAVRPGPGEQLSLSVAGAAACTGAELALRIVLAAVRLAARAERGDLSETQDPVVTFEEAVADANVHLGPDQRRGLARQTGLLLHAEPWTGQILLYEEGWQLTADRRARPYLEVQDVADYWVKRVQQGLADAGPSTFAAGSQEYAGDSGRLIQLRHRWELHEPLDSGGYRRVIAAVGEDGTPAAVKFVPKKPGADRELLFGHLKDVRNVVPVIDSGEDGDAWVLVMPRAQYSLQKRLREAGGPLKVDEALLILIDVAKALADLAARTEPVVHRDIKPANVLFLDGAWCLADFGISRYAEAATATHTRKGAGTLEYTAPERWRGERAGSAADVYSVAVMAFELLSGSLPFTGPDPEDFRQQHLLEQPPALQLESARLATLVAECLNKAPQSRPLARQLLERLEKAGHAEQTPAAAALATAYRQHVDQDVLQATAASHAYSDQARRAELVTAANQSLDRISNQLLEFVQDIAPAIGVRRSSGAQWRLELGAAQLTWTASVPFDGRSWGEAGAPAFDLVAFCTLDLVTSPDPWGYKGRSHSLYYCNAHDEQRFAWYETAFMHHPLIDPHHVSQEPFALNPDDRAAVALRPGMAQYQAAWPFTELVSGEVDDFIDRWVKWLALAAQGQLHRPSQIPERPAENTWRR